LRADNITNGGFAGNGAMTWDVYFRFPVSVAAPYPGVSITPGPLFVAQSSCGFTTNVTVGAPSEPGGTGDRGVLINGFCSSGIANNPVTGSDILVATVNLTGCPGQSFVMDLDTGAAVFGSGVTQIVDTFPDPYVLTAQNLTDGSPICSATCFATADSGTTVFASGDAHAVQQAVDAAPGGGTVKVAGTCVGVESRAGMGQSVYIDKVLTLAGGYATSNWTTSQPLTQPTILDAAGAGRVIYATQDLTVTDMTLRNGSNSGTGGGLMAGAALVLSGVDVVSNTATDANGGGVFATNGANVTGGTFRDNRCVAYCSGGALGSDSGALVISGARFIDNTAGVNGGGVYGAASLSLIDTIFDGNGAAAGEGGAVRNFGGPSVIVNSTFAHNTAGKFGGGAYFTGDASLTGAAFTANSAIEGGGAEFDGAADLTVTTFFNNSASLGGAVLFYGAGPRLVVNSLFAGNTATTSGTAVYVYDATPLTLIHNTITSPTLKSKSALAAGGGTIDITNTIISGHAIGIEVTDSGTVSEDYNLFSGNGADSSGSVNSGGHSLVGDPAFVNPAVFNYHLTAASAAINRGVDAGIYVDFEGDPRPQAGGFDIGYDESPFPSRYNIGNRVFLDENQNGLQDSLEPGIAGVSVSLFRGSGTLIATTATEANGYYRFDGLLAGDYVLRIGASNFAAGQALFGLISGTPDETDPYDGGDRNDNGIGTTPGAFGIASGVIHVGPGLQPVGESDLGPGDAVIPDELANLTIDFAFVQQAASLYLPLISR
jgi:predicted outer membrane repeat protein